MGSQASVTKSLLPSLFRHLDDIADQTELEIEQERLNDVQLSAPDLALKDLLKVELNMKRFHVVSHKRDYYD